MIICFESNPYSLPCKYAKKTGSAGANAYGVKAAGEGAICYLG